MPLLYADWAPWWPLLSPPEVAADEARLIDGLLQHSPGRRIRSLLELGCGGGTTAVHLARRYTLTLLDRSAPMLALAAARVPQARTVEADLRDFTLPAPVDAVLLHDAASYLPDRASVRQAVASARRALAPGGRLLCLPDHTAETFRPGASSGGSDAPDGRGARFLEWSWKSRPDDDTYTVAFSLLLRHAGGRVEHRHETHTLSAFPRAVWSAALREAGFRVAEVPLRRDDGSAGGVAFVADVKGRA
jgi:SAM-dependent methyltransferase